MRSMLPHVLVVGVVVLLVVIYGDQVTPPADVVVFVLLVVVGEVKGSTPANVGDDGVHVAAVLLLGINVNLFWSRKP